MSGLFVGKVHFGLLCEHDYNIIPELGLEILFRNISGFVYANMRARVIVTVTVIGTRAIRMDRSAPSPNRNDSHSRLEIRIVPIRVRVGLLLSLPVELPRHVSEVVRSALCARRGECYVGTMFTA